MNVLISDVFRDKFDALGVSTLSTIIQSLPFRFSIQLRNQIGGDLFVTSQYSCLV